MYFRLFRNSLGLPNILCFIVRRGVNLRDRGKAIATTGPRVQKSPLRPEGTVKAVGISIALHLGLENYEYGQILKPEQRFVIRRTYFKV
jgi:hypothetical protein